MPVRLLALIAVLLAAGVAVWLTIDSDERPSSSRGEPVARPTNDAIPTSPTTLARRLVLVDGALRHDIRDWRAQESRLDDAPSSEMTEEAVYVQRATDMLSRRPRLATHTIRRLPARLANQMRLLNAALRDLHELSAGWPAHHVHVGPPDPLGDLLATYHAAERRFGVGWHVLAAVNFVESAFGRTDDESVAGARGPMQFIPATWRAYGFGGDIRNPHDAILGAANLLDQGGAPRHNARALYAYNPSSLYVDAVLRYAHLIDRDPNAVYLLYSWKASVPTQDRR